MAGRAAPAGYRGNLRREAAAALNGNYAASVDGKENWRVLAVVLEAATPPATKVRAADSILNHTIKAIETEDIEARMAALERSSGSEQAGLAKNMSALTVLAAQSMNVLTDGQHEIGNEVPAIAHAGDDRLVVRRLAGVLGRRMDEGPAVVPGDGGALAQQKRRIFMR